MRRAAVFHGLAAAFLLGSSVQAQTPAAPPERIVVSGFEPFGGRAQNASWVLAAEIAKAFPQEVKAVQVPVVWGAPLKAINSTQPLPQVWIAFGEGTAEFQIEVLAHNQRGQFPDNSGARPASPDVVGTAAAPVLKQQAKVTELAASLTQAGFPTHVSADAGRYLCEEMLYSLLHTQQQHPEALRLVLFVHVPVLGESVGSAPAKAGAPGISRQVDAAWLQAFGRQLFATLHTQGLLPQTPPADSKPR